MILEHLNKILDLVPGTVDDAAKFLRENSETRQNLERVADLVSGFESPFGLELLSTVHWVVTQEDASSIDEVVEQTYNWNPRKKQFTPRQIRIAFNVLTKKGWM